MLLYLYYCSLTGSQVNFIDSGIYDNTFALTMYEMYSWSMEIKYETRWLEASNYSPNVRI